MNDIARTKAIAGIVDTMNSRPGDVAPDKRADFIIQLLEATFDAGGQHHAAEIKRYRGHLYKLIAVTQMLVDELRARHPNEYAGSSARRSFFDCLDASLKNRLADVMRESVD